MGRRGRQIAATALLACWSVLAMAQGGPPLCTDDPETPGPRNWEINVGASLERRNGERNLESPILDVNYGWQQNIQLKFEIPFLLRKTDGRSGQSGWGNSRIGIKWRFLENEKYGLAISTYPQLEFNSPLSSRDGGLVEQGNRFLAPLEMSKTAGPIKLNAEIGYWMVQHEAGEWISGLAIGRQTTRQLELLGELHATGRTNGMDRETTVGVGGRYKLFDSATVLFMVGRSVRGPSSGEPQLIGYLGLQFFVGRKRSEAD